MKTCCQKKALFVALTLSSAVYAWDAGVLFSSGCEGAVQPAGIDFPVTMDGALADGISVSTVSGGSGLLFLRLDNVETVASTGLFISEAAGSNSSSNLSQAVGNNECIEFTVSGAAPLGLGWFSFSMVKHGFSQFAGVTLRSSADGYTSDLATITDSTASGVYAQSVNLAALPVFDGLSSVTFRFYLYDEFSGNNNRRLGIDNITILFAGPPVAAELLAGYDFEAPDVSGRGFLPSLTADGVEAGVFKSSFVDKPHYEDESLGSGVGDNSALPFDSDGSADRSISFRESEWGMNNFNVDQDAVDQKWYFEFSIRPDRYRRMSLSNFVFSAQIANPGKSPDRWFLTSNLDGYEVDTMLAFGEITASSTNDYPAADAAFEKVDVDLSALHQFQNLAREVTFRLYWVADNANTNNDSFNMVRIDKVGIYGELIATSGLETEVYHVADFGAVGDGSKDDGPAIRSAFAAAAAAANPAVVVFATNAVYRFGTYNPEFNQIPLKYTQDLVVEGNGSTLLVNPENRSFLVWRSRDVVVRNFTIDYDPLPWTQGPVLSVDAGNSNFVFQIADGYSDVDASGVEALIPDWDNAVFVDGETGLFTHTWLYPEHLEAVPGESGRYTVFIVPDQVDKLAEVQVGQTFVMSRHEDILDGIDREKRDELGWFYSIGSFTGIIRHSCDVTIENVKINAFDGRAWNVFDSDNVLLDGMAIERKPGTDRAVSGVRGGVIMKELRGGPDIRNSHFEATMDDSMNRSDTPCYLLDIDGTAASLRFAGNKWGDAIIEAGDMVEFWDRINGTSLGTAAVIETIRDSHRFHRILFDTVPSGVLTTNNVALDQVTLLYRVVDEKMIVSNCTFGTQLKKAAICRLPARFENCSFEESNYGIHAYNLLSSEEGPYARDQDYMNLRFKNVGIGAIVLYKPGSPMASINHDIYINGVNIYQDGSAVDAANGISITGMNGVLVTNTTIRFAPDVSGGWELFTVNNSLNVTETNNWFVDERFPSTDSDFDGLPDWWEQAYFNGTGPGADDDSDGDGVSNINEFRAATNPSDPDSVFRVSMDRNAVSWNSEYGRTYTLQQSTSLVSGAWTDIVTNQLPTPPSNEYPAIIEDSGFYRIVISP